MYKLRKNKALPLMLALVFAFTVLVPVGGVAFAATTYSSITTPKVEDDGTRELGRVLVEVDRLATGTHEAWVDLPSDFEIMWSDNITTVTDATYDGVQIVETGADGGPLPANVTVELRSLSDDGFLLHVNNNSGSNLIDFEIELFFNKIDIDSGAENGAIEATFDNIRGQLLSGKVTIGYVAAGELTLSVRDSGSFGDNGGEVTIRVTEESAASLNDDDELKLQLPRGFEWGNATASYVFGNIVADNVYIDADEDELIVRLKDNVTGTTERSAFDIVARIVVDDPDDANMGDVEVRVRGDYDATPSTLIVGTYGDYGATISVKGDVPTLIAGFDEQEIAEIEIKETLMNSLIEGRTVTLTLPEGARWQPVFEVYDTNNNPADLEDFDRDNGLQVDFERYTGSNDRTARYVVEHQSNDNATITLEDVEVALEPGFTGDLVITVGGSAGLSGELVVADVVPPVTVNTGDEATLRIGAPGQAVADFTITEAEAEAIDTGYMEIELKNGVSFTSTPKVTVTDGDLRIDNVRLTNNDETLRISIDRKSRDASTITVSDVKLTVDRTVPYGGVDVKVKGDAVVQTGDVWSSKTAAKANIAIVGTPAADTKLTTSITLGDNGSYISDGRIMVQLRDAANALGVANQNIFWDNDTKTATLIKGDRVVQITEGKAQVVLNGMSLPTDKGAEIKDGRTFVALSQAGIALGAVAEWDNDTKTATLTIE